MRFHSYNRFLSSQLSFQDIQRILGEEDHKYLIDHFGESPAVFDAELVLNEEAYDMAMNSFVVCKHSSSYDVIVYTCDGRQPCRKGNYFIKDSQV